MGNIVETLKKAKEVIEQTTRDPYLYQLLKIEELMKEIDEAVEMPELHIETPNGDLVASVAHNEAIQASICLEHPELGPVDLFLAEVPEGDLLKLYEERDGLKEGDIRMLSWTDIGSEDYTRLDVITTEKIKEQAKDTKEMERE